MRIHNRNFVLALLLTTACTAFGAGSGDMATPSDQRPIPKSPETQALTAYNSGVRLVEKADHLGADAARQTDEHKQKKVLDKARQNYSAALRKFAQAIEFQSGMYQAWNYLGYTQRKLGNYQDALIAYDRALSIKPGYAEAIEYRGHA
jgi:tetratricopeptide (TPR) repeat protein